MTNHPWSGNTGSAGSQGQLPGRDHIWHGCKTCQSQLSRNHIMKGSLGYLSSMYFSTREVLGPFLEIQVRELGTWLQGGPPTSWGFNSFLVRCDHIGKDLIVSEFLWSSLGPILLYLSMFYHFSHLVPSMHVCDVMWCDEMWRDVTWRDVMWCSVV